MNNEPEDDELRSLLRETGRERRRCAPPFQQVWRAAHERRAPAPLWRTPVPLWRWWPAWGLVATAAVCAVLFLSRPPAPVLRTGEPMPTDFLLVAGEDAAAGRIADEISALLQP